MPAMKAGNSLVAPGWGRKYSDTPDLVAACKVLTCRLMVRSAAQPLLTRLECS